MTWVMEEGAQAPVRENQGWRGEEMNNSLDRITLLSLSRISLIRTLHFFKLFKGAYFCVSSTPHLQLLAAFIERAFTYFKIIEILWLV